MKEIEKISGTCFVFQRDMLRFLGHTSVDVLSNSGVEGQRAMHHRCYQPSVLLPGPRFFVHLYLHMWTHFKEVNREKKFQLVIFSSLDMKCTAKRCMCLQFLPQLEAGLRSERCQYTYNNSLQQIDFFGEQGLVGESRLLSDTLPMGLTPRTLPLSLLTPWIPWNSKSTQHPHCQDLLSELTPKALDPASWTVKLPKPWTKINHSSFKFIVFHVF